MAKSEIEQALQQMWNTAQDRLKEWEPIEVLSTTEIREDLKVDLLLLRWKESGKVALECRRLYKSKSGEWKLGRRARIGLTEIDAIMNNIERIKSVLK